MALAKEEERRKEEEERRRQADIDRARAEERQKILEIERAKEQERKKVEAETAKVEEARVPETEEEPFSQEDEIDDLPFATPTTVTAFYKIIATPEELEEVEMAFNSIGIIFERREI
jgi:primosomal protein N'